MQFKISNKQEKTSTNTGKKYISATLTDEQGVEYTGINAFNGEFNVADTWHGELQKNGNYYNLVSPKMVAGSNFKAQQIEKAVERKEHSIERFQDSKEFAIRTASTMSGAVSIATAVFKQDPNDLRTMEELVLHYREWLWTHWSDSDKFAPF